MSRYRCPICEDFCSEWEDDVVWVDGLDRFDLVPIHAECQGKEKP